jgi:hypothetical protein
MKKSKRYIITIIAGIVLGILAAFAIFKGIEVVAGTCIAGILTILSTYIWGETKRPSIRKGHLGKRNRNRNTTPINLR